MPTMRTKRWTDAEIPAELASAVDELFAGLFALHSAQGIEGDDEPRMVDLTGATRETWAAFVDTHNQDLQGLEGHARAAGAKLEGYAARFALIIRRCQQAVGEKDSEYIEAADIEAGVSLAQWFGEETRRVYCAMHETSEDRRRRELREWIAQHGERVTVRDMQRNLRRYAHDPDQAEADLNDLESCAYGSCQPSGTGTQGGRPTRIFCLALSPDFPIVTDADTTPESNGKYRVSSASAG